MRRVTELPWGAIQGGVVQLILCGGTVAALVRQFGNPERLREVHLRIFILLLALFFLVPFTIVITVLAEDFIELLTTLRIRRALQPLLGTVLIQGGFNLLLVVCILDQRLPNDLQFDFGELLFAGTVGIVFFLWGLATFFYSFDPRNAED
jgi:hypothetical protein